MSSVFDAVLGLNIPPGNTINPEVIETSKAICNSGYLQSITRNTNFENPCDMPDIVFGQYYNEKVDRSLALYYRLILDNINTENGFIINVESYNKDKFKLVILNEKGELVVQEDSNLTRNKKSTQIILYFNSFPTYKLPDSPSLTKDASKADTLPPVLTIFDKFQPSTKTISTGNYLLYVYGDNEVFGKSSYRMIVAPFTTKLSPRVRTYKTH